MKQTNLIRRLAYLMCIFVASHAFTHAQQLQFSKKHGLYSSAFNLTITDTLGLVKEGATIRYTLDGSTPDKDSPTYVSPLRIKGNTILRAAVVNADTLASEVTTQTYLFLDDVLHQPEQPTGYPTTWGKYTDISGTAVADYGMDPEMTGNAAMALKIKDGFRSLPILSIVTDRDNLFSHENDPDKGGIYIFTGPPVGDNTGHGWTRPASVELFGGKQFGLDGLSNGHEHDMSVTCGLRLHGGHGRLAEKNPKHSFRLVFKKEYGKKTLHYPIYGEGEPDKFDQLVLRCHYGNTWQHWLESNRQKAQYTRDVWARRMQRKMGWTSVNALYVHMFLNGMYWGMYNIAERVDGQFGKDHLGGKKDSIDVIKIEEDGGSHLEASEGDMEAWNLMVQTAKKAFDDASYYRLQGKTPDGEDDPELEALLDIDAFIDYILINQYGGNTDWDHHNWYALRRKGAESQGFRFLCWDSEMILDNPKENILSVNNGSASPTGILHNLLNNEQFAIRYLKRAKEVMADDGWLGQKSAEALWDSLYTQISKALYDEAARWGDYRRDVHPYSSRGSLYTVDDTYKKEHNRLHNEYFPVRAAYVLDKIKGMLNVNEMDLLDVPDEWMALNSSMFHKWSGSGADAMQLDTPVNVDWNMKMNASGGTAVAGFANVDHDTYADITDYETLVIRGTGTGLRILSNRLEAHGSYKQIRVNFNQSDPYWDDELQAIVIPVEKLRTIPTTDGDPRQEDFVHLHVLKVDWNSGANIRGAWLVPTEEMLAVQQIEQQQHTAGGFMDGKYRNLQGQIVQNPAPGIYIRNGKKIVVR